MTTKQVGLVLGTMTIGEQIFGDDVRAMIEHFLDKGYRELDTAYVYNEGECERLLGAALPDFPRESYDIATKANPRITGRLDKDAVKQQLNESLERLGLDAVDIFYLHFPDPETPILSALEGCAELYEEGKFRELGLSNFPAWLVAEVYRVSEAHGWVLPTVYEGVYNPLSRHAERELNTALDHYGMRFYAYNPLAGGILTPKYSGETRELKEGRFTHRPNYQARYWNDAYFEASDHVKDVCKAHDIGIVEAVYRWLIHHSMLDGARGDKVIVGASRLSQLEQNMAAADKGPLPEEVLEAFEAAWTRSRVAAPEYFRYYRPSR